jgi:homoserine kinase
MSRTFRTIRVPASSANLGPGFDALGLALGVYLECRFRPAARLSIQASGRDADSIPTSPENMIWQTALEVAGAPLDPIELLIDNDIPIGKGLGSSAAAMVAGVVMANELASFGWDRARILNEAARIEGHPDNVAACVLGGIVASAIDSCNVVRVVRMDLHPRYGVAVVVPDFPLPTSEARRVLPSSYSREDTIFNVQRAALLIAALAAGATGAFPAALEDRLHQPYRFALVPGLEAMTRLRAPGLLGCVLSGAGPSILVFYERGSERVCELVRSVFSSYGHASEIFWTEVDRDGYRLSDGLPPS